MLGQALDEQAAIETLVDDIVEQYHDVCHLVDNREVDNLEVILRVEHVQVLDNLLVGDITLTERSCLVEDRQSIAHATISLVGYDCQCLFLVGNAFLLCHRLQMFNGVTDSHTFKVVDLAATQDGGQNLMFLRCGQDKDDMCGWLFQRLQESIESSC